MQSFRSSHRPKACFESLEELGYRWFVNPREVLNPPASEARE